MTTTTRHAVAISSINTGMLGQEFLVLAGEALSVNVEVDGTTNQFYLNWAASPPDPIATFRSSMGSFLNVYVLALVRGLEVRIDESIDASGGTSVWARALARICTPGVLTKVDGFRVNQSFARVSFVNTNTDGTFVNGTVGLKVVTI